MKKTYLKIKLSERQAENFDYKQCYYYDIPAWKNCKLLKNGILRGTEEDINKVINYL